MQAAKVNAISPPVLIPEIGEPSRFLLAVRDAGKERVIVGRKRDQVFRVAPKGLCECLDLFVIHLTPPARDGGIQP
ncbi:hypothetical protein GOD93_21105 [Sinorhizobium medicae]|nr:hypothetical protein [Sinorhizobium medicae]MDX0948145.1 hypothetical protein [Sinorhizobium medicae]